MPDYKSPGVYVEEVSSGNKPIESAGSSTAAFIGEGAIGPLNEPVPLANWSQFTKYFGGFEHSPFLAHSLYQWFANGGGLAFVSLVGRPDAAEAPVAPATGDKPEKPKPVAKPASKAGLFIGEDGGPGKRSGLHVFSPIREVSIVVAPGQSDQAIHDAILTHCEVNGDRFAILDCPEDLGTSLDQMYKPRDSKYGAYYFPWLQVFDPVSKANKFIPPSGPVAGIYARTDAERGVHKAPANELVRGALGLKYNLTSAEQALLNPRGINLIRDMGDRGIRVWGARTVSSDPEWRYINVRRLFLVIEQSILAGTQWCVFEPNDQNLWKKIVRNVRAYLMTVWRSGALFGETPEQAFFVKCDSETNPPELIDMGQVNISIGIAPVKPAEFVIFKIGQLAAGG
jgi:phage tail sheath protein FI